MLYNEDEASGMCCVFLVCASLCPYLQHDMHESGVSVSKRLVDPAGARSEALQHQNDQSR